MIILRQNNFSFLTPRKDADKLWKAIQDYKEYDDVALPPETNSFSQDFKCWLGFIETELKYPYYILGERDRLLYIYLYKPKQVLKDFMIAGTDQGTGGFNLVYDKNKKSYVIKYGTMKAMFLSRGINKLFRQEGKVYYECKTVLEGLNWLRKNVFVV